MKTAKFLARRAPVVALGTSILPAAAVAAPPDYTALTAAIDVSTTTAALLAVGATLIAITLVMMGIRKVMRMVRGA